MQTKSRTLKKISGYTLVELVIYIALLSVVTVLVVYTVISFTKSYHDLGALRAVEHSANDAMERMTREIRGATSVNTGQSTLDSSPGVLTLTSTRNNISTTTKYYIQNSIIKTDINGVYSGPLSLSNAVISSLVFKDIKSSVSEAVKIDMTVQATVGGVTKVKNYHSTIILRGQ